MDKEVYEEKRFGPIVKVSGEGTICTPENFQEHQDCSGRVHKILCSVKHFH
jgi:hypothetical protein